GISSGDGSSDSARSPAASLKSPFTRRFFRAGASGSDATGSATGARARDAEDPTIARTGVHASVAAIRNHAASATNTHAPNVPNQLRHQSATRAPHHPAPALATPGGGGESTSASATGNSSTMPAKKIIHDRSVRDSSRPNNRSACTAGT